MKRQFFYRYFESNNRHRKLGDEIVILISRTYVQSTKSITYSTLLFRAGYSCVTDKEKVCAWRKVTIFCKETGVCWTAMIRSGPSKKGYSTSSASDTVSMTLALPDGVYVMLNVGFFLMLNVVFLFVHSSFCSGTGNYINRLIHREKTIFIDGETELEAGGL